MAILLASDFSSPAARARRIQAGEIMPLARGVWTDEVKDKPEDVVARRWKEIVGRVMPGAVVTDRSGFSLRPLDGQLFVSHSRAASLVLPGLTVYPDGRDDFARAGDMPMDGSGTIFAASRTRALIDNAEARGRPAAVQRRFTRAELHEEIARIVATSTSRQVDQMIASVKEDSNKVATDLVELAFKAARGDAVKLSSKSRAMNAAQSGELYDQARVALFSNVVSVLQNLHPVQRYINDPARATLVPFYEAYFSNYIEGSTLSIDEAERVVFEDADVGDPKDAHDIRATWEIVADDGEMSRSFTTADEFMDALRDRHRVMMAAHPEKLPGEWKVERNRAGATEFVEPSQVPGTLRAGWEEGQVLTDPFQRAVYAMFLVSEVHPFADGNGRSARVALNAELVRHGMHRIIIPSILRIDYISGLLRTTAGNGPEALYRVLEFAQQWVAVGEFRNLEIGDRYLRATNALYDSGVAEHEGIRLKILRPGELFELPEASYPEPVTNETRTPSLLDGAAALADHDADNENLA